jgi:hypothetical protein
MKKFKKYNFSPIIPSKNINIKRYLFLQNKKNIKNKPHLRITIYELMPLWYKMKAKGGINHE